MRRRRSRLLIRILQDGHDAVYEPSAIIWHEHPDGAPRLRRQVYRYGVGLTAMLAKHILVGQERLRILRLAPAGVRYALDPSSRKNADKPLDYPRSLHALERLGMVVGPGAYLAAVARGQDALRAVKRVEVRKQ